MKLNKLFSLLAMTILTFGLLTSVQAEKSLSLDDRVVQHRALETIVWSMPMVSSKMMRDGLQKDAGVGLNDVAYFSKIQNWKIDFTTNNNTTPYIHVYWNVEKEPNTQQRNQS